jgi:hypothetical protein
VFEILITLLTSELCGSNRSQRVKQTSKCTSSQEFSCIRMRKFFLSFLSVLFYLAVSRGFYLWMYRQLVGHLGRVISPTQGLYLHRTTQHRETQTHIHAPSRIRTWDLIIRETEDSTCLRPLGYWDRPSLILSSQIFLDSLHVKQKSYLWTDRQK